MTHPPLDPASAALIPPMMREEITTAVRTALHQSGLAGTDAGAVLEAAARAAATTRAAEHLTSTALLHVLSEVGTDLGTENAGGDGRPDGTAGRVRT
nr:hypothetical protein KPHV_84920 [Kitasatospora purpeofusca]BEK71555.1 hypothetical protein KPHV_87820 [Kitasatospora purpeofusca]